MSTFPFGKAKVYEQDDKEPSLELSATARAMHDRYRKRAFEREESREPIAGEIDPSPIDVREAIKFFSANPTREQMRKAHEMYEITRQPLLYETEIILDSWIHFGGKPLGIDEFVDGISMLREFRYPWIQPKTVQMSARTAMELTFSSKASGRMIEEKQVSPIFGDIKQLYGVDIVTNDYIPGSMAMFFDESNRFLFGFMAFGYRFTGTADDFGAQWRMPVNPNSRERSMRDYIQDYRYGSAELSDTDIDSAADEADSDDFVQTLDEIFND